MKLKILLFFILINNLIFSIDLKIALAQLEVISNQPEKNISKMVQLIEEAKRQNVDIIIFPELCISGYFLGDSWLNKNFCLNLMHFNKIIKNTSENIVIIFGNLYADKNYKNKDGTRRKYNGAYIFQNRKKARRTKETDCIPKGIQPKTLLPNYRIFDDERYFYSTIKLAQEHDVELKELIQPFEVCIRGRNIKIGLEVCEDLWLENYRYRNDYLNVTKMLIENGADIIVNISASPWNYGKNQRRHRNIKFLKSLIGKSFKPFIYVNNVGAQNNGKNIITFDGGSCVYNENGDPISEKAEPYQEKLIICENFDTQQMEQKERTKIEEKLNAIIYGIKHLKNIIGIDTLKFVIGISGGIDSAVVISVLSLITSAENILAFNMPTKFNSEKTKGVASKVCNNLGITLNFLPIEELVEVNQQILEKYDQTKFINSIKLNNENIMAKIRGTSILSNLAQRHNAILVNNGNKLEIALGYATLYGDVNGAIAPIGDLTKAEIFELAKFLNENIFKKEVIPNELIPDENYDFKEDQVAPTAELRENQLDPMKFGYHDALLEKMTTFPPRNIEDFAKWYSKGKLIKKLEVSESLFKKHKLNNPKFFFEDLEWFCGLIAKNVFKRIQAPPIIISSRSCYGFDIRESQIPFYKSKNYEIIKSRLLSGD